MSTPGFQAASRLASYPASDGAAVLAALAAELPAAAPLAGMPALERESDYVELFDRGVAEQPLHATGYARGRAFGAAERLADVAGFYRAFGLAPNGGEQVDHVAVELEFYAWLLLKAAYLERLQDIDGVEIVLDARRKFVAEHLGPLAAAIARRPAVAAHPGYGPVFAWIAELVAGEARALDVEYVALELAPRGAREPDEVECAAAAHRRAASARLPVLG